MNKKDILEKLKEYSQNRDLKFPKDMDFEIQGGVLTITLSEKGVTGNMQDNPSAFEGWALCIKAWLPELVRKVCIEFDEVYIERGAKISPEYRHYMRFLYRLWKFVGTFDWATTNSYKFDNCNLGGWVVNVPKTKAKKKAEKENDEAQLERDYVNKHKSEFDAMNHQLPVGVFKSGVAEGNRIMTRGALDIWAIKGDELSVFELKKDGNSKIGILSELMFYCNIMDDLMTHRINYTDDAQKCTFRGFEKLYYSYKNRTINIINGVFLTNKRHPLISDAVIELMNTNSVRIKYSHQTVGNL